MLQQILALIIIIFFLIRLFDQKRKKQLNANEFLLWLIFWLCAATAIILIKQIDRLVAQLGFSGAAINILVYIVVLILVYTVFRMRLNIAKMDKNITELTRTIALKKEEKK